MRGCRPRRTCVGDVGELKTSVGTAGREATSTARECGVDGSCGHTHGMRGCHRRHRWAEDVGQSARGGVGEGRRPHGRVAWTGRGDARSDPRHERVSSALAMDLCRGWEGGVDGPRGARRQPRHARVSSTRTPGDEHVRRHQRGTRVHDVGELKTSVGTAGHEAPSMAWTGHVVHSDTRGMKGCRRRGRGAMATNWCGDVDEIKTSIGIVGHVLMSVAWEGGVDGSQGARQQPRHARVSPATTPGDGEDAARCTLNYFGALWKHSELLGGTLKHLKAL
ncbi:hypothetical protein GOP47_0026770 [Adiantum capillus-veneris]|nr:hypothetical protein GOP47_0026770 [Adiantum capillus-veneris]